MATKEQLERQKEAREAYEQNKELEVLIMGEY